MSKLRELPGLTLCKVCGKPFKPNSNAQKYCLECADYYSRAVDRLGNPRQDVNILRFIRKKRG